MHDKSRGADAVALVASALESFTRWLAKISGTGFQSVWIGERSARTTRL